MGIIFQCVQVFFGVGNALLQAVFFFFRTDHGSPTTVLLSRDGEPDQICEAWRWIVHENEHKVSLLGKNGSLFDDGVAYAACCACCMGSLDSKKIDHIRACILPLLQEVCQSSSLLELIYLGEFRLHGENSHLKIHQNMLLFIKVSYDDICKQTRILLTLQDILEWCYQVTEKLNSNFQGYFFPRQVAEVDYREAKVSFPCMNVLKDLNTMWCELLSLEDQKGARLFKMGDTPDLNTIYIARQINNALAVFAQDIVEYAEEKIDGSGIKVLQQLEDLYNREDFRVHREVDSCVGFIPDNVDPSTSGLSS